MANYFSRIDYAALDARQKEVHNFHIIAALLANHGFATYPIRDDWNGGDMIARHMTEWGRETMTIQIKSRLTFDRKYQNKRLWVGFPIGDAAFVYPHDEILQAYLAIREAKGLPLENSRAWTEGGCVHWAKPTDELLDLLQPYLLSADRGDKFVYRNGELEMLETSDSAPPRS